MGGGGGGGREGRVPPGWPNSFDFMQFSGKFGKIICWLPPPPPPHGELAPQAGEILDPPVVSIHTWGGGGGDYILSLEF